MFLRKCKFSKFCQISSKINIFVRTTSFRHFFSFSSKTKFLELNCKLWKCTGQTPCSFEHYLVIIMSCRCADIHRHSDRKIELTRYLIRSLRLLAEENQCLSFKLSAPKDVYVVAGNSTTFSIRNESETTLHSRVKFTFHMRRKPLYYIANLVIPCCLLSCIVVITFILPPDCYIRLTLSTYNNSTLDSRPTRRVKLSAKNGVAT